MFHVHLKRMCVLLLLNGENSKDAMRSPGSQLCSPNSGSSWGPAWFPPSWSVVWKHSRGNNLGNCNTHLICFPFLRHHCLTSNVSHFFCLKKIVYFRHKVKSSPCYSISSRSERTISSFLFSLILPFCCQIKISFLKYKCK